MKKAITWGLVGAVAGFMIGGFIAGVLGVNYSVAYVVEVVSGIVVGVLAFTSSKKNNGNPPAWLWRSGKNNRETEMDNKK